MLILVIALIASATLMAQVPTPGLRLWLRADSLVTTNNEGHVQTWSNIVDQRAAVVGSDVVTISNVNGKAAFSFNGLAHLVAPSVFPMGSDYTIVVVARVGSTNGANNIVSGNTRAMWLNSSLFPRMLHNDNFDQQAVSKVSMDGLSVVRVRFAAASGIARIAVNNREGAADLIPQNTDSTIFIGAYVSSNFFNGQISEVLLYNREVKGAELTQLDEYLHSRYGITRVPEPPAPSVTFDDIPSNLLVARCNDSVFVSGRVAKQGVRSVTISVDSANTRIIERSTTNTLTGSYFKAGFVVRPGTHTYSVLVVADTDVAPLDTVAYRSGIVCGEVISICGQSNSIYGASGTPVSPLARTFGGNFSQQRSDTLYQESSAEGNGGGANVGAWGLYLQNIIASEMGVPTLVINGGVSGTRIEQHLPDPVDRLNLSTIYGSWLYRVAKSGARERIRWMFWYQGEYNGDNDDYLTLFDRLRSAWLEDLPNLQYIVVVQIRPGCGPAGHEKIRDTQRLLENRYPDVFVHAASGLPQHDGCHYYPNGYYTLGQQLYSIYQRNELGMQPGRYATSPSVEAAACMDGNCNSVRITFKRANQMRMTPDSLIAGAIRTSRDAFFANGDPNMIPTKVNVTSNAVELTFANSVARVSYIPDKTYVGTNDIYEGPWLVNADGVGALTFHNVETQPTSVAEERIDRDNIEMINEKLLAHDVRGRIVATSREQLAKLGSGVYIVLRPNGRATKLLIP